MSNKRIDINKVYKYRNGEPARILCVDAPTDNDSPVVSLSNTGYLTCHNATGMACFLGESEYDLIEVKEEKTLEFWVAINSDRTASLFNTPDYIRNLPDLIARKKVIITYCEGDEE
jgi:hypothetical protein